VLQVRDASTVAFNMLSPLIICRIPVHPLFFVLECTSF
jgi:hypothetical protein